MSTSTNLFVNPINGNVGIGTTNPKSNFHINGFISINIPSFYVKSSSAQTISAWGASIKIDYNDTPILNRFNLYNITTKRLEPPVNGIYFIYACYTVANATEHRYQYITITKNSTAPTDVTDTFSDVKRIGFGGASHHTPSTSNCYLSINATAIVELSTTDYIEIFGSGSATSTKYTGIDSGNFFMAYLISVI
jgi:hypothetical protein